MHIFNIHSVINQALVEPLALSFSPFRVDCGTSLSHKTLFIHFHAHSQNMRKKKEKQTLQSWEENYWARVTVRVFSFSAEKSSRPITKPFPLYKKPIILHLVESIQICLESFGEELVKPGLQRWVSVDRGGVRGNVSALKSVYYVWNLDCILWIGYCGKVEFHLVSRVEVNEVDVRAHRL